uniref:Acyltransferase n=1 Tax=Chromera velia CCMP2878 TaxID=1169474 RepID=A0A0G4FP85_9ALVE|mmetsp:Transcript_37002/g.72779  ORF Transcript_37002/g.72779 Transcript_37002/m.72779 type:complete len:366 (+) Transcript_37002:250-1347(+)|eukprot:Cvel_3546.t1-p1 / transcript=Cvel_3546.t1 / gene=Cvel_3546 / organism=Chromera_velia_CCMP2878 / gene_product=Diacylglycerol O-acyltransferase 2, putative / transcript_product=Diacylglycerol O-acyltransferase 2, putative / location=Cvel_scaffold144:105188-106282(-) / protein_length=365 / sequence_SO=supercontig / SO=protein_coding / is_pseudo=false
MPGKTVIECSKPLKLFERIVLDIWLIVFYCTIHVAIFGSLCLAFSSFRLYAFLLVLLYIAATCAYADSTKEGAPWREFTENFYFIGLGRRFFPLTVTLTDGLWNLAETFHKASEEERREIQKQQWIIASFPHGVECNYRLLVDGLLYRALPFLGPWRSLAASVLFRVPFLREVALFTHCVDASRDTAEFCLRKGFSIQLIPGGEMEQVLTHKGKETVYLKRRTGFIRLALKFQAKVIPQYVFGQNDCFETTTFLLGLRTWIVKNLRMCFTLSWGSWSPIHSQKVAQNVVFGDPLDAATFAREWIKKKGKDAEGVDIDKWRGKGKEAEPPKELIEACHAEFMRRLTETFDTFKGEYGYGSRELQVI